MPRQWTDDRLEGSTPSSKFQRQLWRQERLPCERDSRRAGASVHPGDSSPGADAPCEAASSQVREYGQEDSKACDPGRHTWPEIVLSGGGRAICVCSSNINRRCKTRRDLGGMHCPFFNPLDHRKRSKFCTAVGTVNTEQTTVHSPVQYNSYSTGTLERLRSLGLGLPTLTWLKPPWHPARIFWLSLRMAALVAVGRARAQEALKDLDSAEDDNAMRMPADKDCILMGQFGRKVIG